MNSAICLRIRYEFAKVPREGLCSYYITIPAIAQMAILFVISVGFLTAGVFMAVEESTTAARSHFRVTYSHAHHYQYPRGGNWSDEQAMTEGILQTFSINGSTVSRQGVRTVLQIVAPVSLDAPVHLYYRTTGFFQSTSYFHEGRSQLQMVHEKIDSSLAYRCEPFLVPGSREGATDRTMLVQNGSRSLSYSSMRYYPCGTAPWSKFNDTLRLYQVRSVNSSHTAGQSLEALAARIPIPNRTQSGQQRFPQFLASTMAAAAANGSSDAYFAWNATVLCDGGGFDKVGNPLSGVDVGSCSKKDISWPADVHDKYYPIKHSPTSWTANYPFGTTDPFLEKGWYVNEPGHAVPDPEELDLQVWMSPAASDTMRKLYRILHSPIQKGDLLVLEVDEYFDVSSFGGTKQFVFRSPSMSWLHESNRPIAGLYIMCGSVALLCGLILLCVQCCSGSPVIAPLVRRSGGGGGGAPTNQSFVSTTVVTDDWRANMTATPQPSSPQPPPPPTSHPPQRQDNVEDEEEPSGGQRRKRPERLPLEPESPLYIARQESQQQRPTTPQRNNSRGTPREQSIRFQDDDTRSALAPIPLPASSMQQQSLRAHSRVASYSDTGLTPTRMGAGGRFTPDGSQAVVVPSSILEDFQDWVAALVRPKSAGEVTPLQRRRWWTFFVASKEVQRYVQLRASRMEEEAARRVLLVSSAAMLAAPTTPGEGDTELQQMPQEDEPSQDHRHPHHGGEDDDAFGERITSPPLDHHPQQSGEFPASPHITDHPDDDSGRGPFETPSHHHHHLREHRSPRTQRLHSEEPLSVTGVQVSAAGGDSQHSSRSPFTEDMRVGGGGSERAAASS